MFSTKHYTDALANITDIIPQNILYQMSVFCFLCHQISIMLYDNLEIPQSSQRLKLTSLLLDLTFEQS